MGVMQNRVLWLSVWLGLTLPAIGGEPPVTALVIAPRGEFVVAGSQSGLTIYRWPELAFPRTVKVAMANVHDLAFAPDGSRLAVAGGDPAVNGRVHLLAWPSCELLAVLGDQQPDTIDDCVMQVAWRDDTALATASLDRKVVVWDTTDLAAIQRLDQHSRGVLAVGWINTSSNPSSGNTLSANILSGGLDHHLRLWDGASGAIRRSLNNHTGPILALAARPTTNEGLAMVATTSDDATVRFWQPTIGRMMRFAKLSSVALSVGWLSDGRRLAVGCADGHVRIIDSATASIQADVAVDVDRINALVIHPEGDQILVGGRNGQIARVQWSE